MATETISSSWPRRSRFGRTSICDSFRAFGASSHKRHVPSAEPETEDEVSAGRRVECRRSRDSGSYR